MKQNSKITSSDFVATNSYETGSIDFSNITVNNAATFNYTPAPNTITINSDDGKMLVNIKSNGKMEFGESYEPDKAALIFWQAVKNQGKNWNALDKENASLHEEIHHLRSGIKQMFEENKRLRDLATKATAELAKAHNDRLV